MKFLDWLLGKDWDKPQAKEAPASAPKPKKMQRVALLPVPKWTHPGKKGKTIYCPHCNASTHVYNFSWSKLVCSSCGAETNKYLWLISKDVQ